MSKVYFAHRPPSVGVHLLSDPFPPRTVSLAALQTKEESLAESKTADYGKQDEEVGLADVTLSKSLLEERAWL